MKRGADLLKNELFVAWVALLVTLAHAGINAIFYFRGSQVEVGASDVVFYLQSGPGGSALSGAVELVVTNGSPWYGDALIGASAELIPAAKAQVVRLPSYEGLVSPRFDAPCPAESACLEMTSLSVQFLDDDVKSVPTSGAQSAWVSFELPCAAFGGKCNARDGLESMKALLNQEWTLEVTGKFVHEGKVSASCRFGPVAARNFEAVKAHKWTSFKCRNSGR